MTDVTTIKVPRPLRERISQDAARRGMSAASLISELMDRYEREQRLQAVGRAYATRPDSEYLDETATWDQAVADGWSE